MEKDPLRQAVTAALHELGNVLVPLDVLSKKGAVDQAFLQQALLRLWTVRRELKEALEAK